jgi:hypothetical protein
MWYSLPDQVDFDEALLLHLQTLYAKIFGKWISYEIMLQNKQ